MKVGILGSKNTLTGFGLAGIKKGIVAAQEKEQLLKQFNELTDDQEIGVIITDNSSESIRDHIVRFVESNKAPLIIEVPGHNESIENGVIELISKKATGAKG